MRALAGDLANQVVHHCVQFHGGIGYMAEHWTSRFFRDTRLDSIGAGADRVPARRRRPFGGRNACNSRSNCTNGI